MNPKSISPLYYKIQFQLQKKTNQIILEITLEALQKPNQHTFISAKSKYKMKK